MHNKLYLSQVNSQFAGRLLKFKGSQLWNRLPNDLSDISSFESFKKRLRHFLIESIYYGDKYRHIMQQINYCGGKPYIYA